MKLDILAADILDSACPNGGTDKNGNDIYVIETHCVEWRITATKRDGQWRVIDSEARPA